MEIINQYKLKQVNLSGGEPLLYEDIYTLIGWFNKLNIKVNIYTSGVVDDIRYKLLMLKDLFNVNKIVFPIYSTRETLHNFITNTNSFEKTKYAIEFSLSLKLNTEVHIVPMQINLYDLDDTIFDLKNIGIEKINILKLVPQGRTLENKYLIPDNIALEQEIKRLKNKWNNYIKLGLPFNEQHECIAGKEKLVIQPNGVIIPCESFKSGQCMCQRIGV
jgi:MoaA/NifB/PqqE/SkfB family radical SAM enzyme